MSNLEEKIPSRQVMVDTQIGHTINKMRKHEDKDIALAAKKVYFKWKTFFKEKRDKPKIEVRSDLKTEKMREAGRKFIKEALGKHHKGLAENIEVETFQCYKRLISAEYKKTIRKIIFTLRHQEEVKRKTVAGEMKVNDLIKLCSKA
ncbi:transcription elongation factor A N-terminal and central domain-containing protein 2 isoform X2 [Lingula anatina]|nr:transcription elongation factor A N-terminal and central domain-containing protein 2 isoform X2 [Lingula anatina]|eukprot:XP_013415235.1 transcription elongation factor A N-terminal and central domain-containing protein 2 isoform X2 [Lingula anatina]